MMSSMVNSKPPDTIGAFFESLSAKETTPLPQRFAELKRKLIPTKEAEQLLVDGWKRLLAELKVKNPEWAAKGPSNIPQVSFEDLVNGNNSSPAAAAIRECGTMVVKGVVSPDQALKWKQELLEYIKKNPAAKGFPEHDPQVFDLFWTPGQMAARSHQRVIQVLTRVNQLCTVSSDARISLSNPVLYADRCRVRHPGDTSFSLGPHSDSGTIERWEDEAYSSVYRQIAIKWEDWDPWKIDGRIDAKTDLYDSQGGSSVFRTFQGWIAMSYTGPGEGTLRVHPSVKHAISYFWMRPFFTAIKPRKACSTNDEFLSAENWRLDLDSASFPGTPPGRGSEFSNDTHPHLQLDITMTSVPAVQPGDHVFWHCDAIHSVESKHGGKGDSSVMYIGAAPLTELNAEYVLRQKVCFIEGVPPPDFPGGVGESKFTGRVGENALESAASRAGMGFAGFTTMDLATDGEKHVVQRANEILGFA